MEDRIKWELDHLSAHQTERLLREEMEMQISAEQAQRIKHSVHQKIKGERRAPQRLSRKLLAWAAAFVIVVAALSLTGFDNVAAALGQLFHFIPGYGIIESRQIEYVLSKQVSSENDKAKLTLSNAVATDSSVTVMFTLVRKNWDEAQGAKDKQEEWERLQKGGSLTHINVTLFAGDRALSKYSGYTGGGGASDTSTFTYELNKEEIGPGITYRLEYVEYGLTVEFTLKKYDSYTALEEIGATGYHNDISITAVPTYDEGKVTVDLYAINKSGYTLYSFGKADAPYNKNDDIHLITESGTKDYTVPGGYMGVNGRFLFDILQSDCNFTLKVPYITVKSSEEKNITLPIPEVGEKAAVNQKIEFIDCVMTIVEVERTSSHIGEYGELKMTVQYDNKSQNKIMLHPEFIRTNIFGMSQSGAWSADVDENGVYTTVYYALDKGEHGQLRLKVHSPLYCLTDGYELKFSR